MVTTKSGSIKAIPAIRELPLLGILPSFLSQERLHFLHRLSQQYDICRFHLGPYPIIFFSKVEHIQAILVEQADTFSKGRLMHKAVPGNGLFISEGEFHRKQRKLMAPLFQPRHISQYADTIVQYSEQIAQSWSDGSIIDLNHTMVALTMTIIGKILFDVDMFDETDTLGEAMAIGFEHTVRKLSNPLMLPESLPTAYNQRVKQATKTLEDRLRLMIEDRRHNLEMTHRIDLLSVLLLARDDDGQPMSDAQLMDECTILFGAGHETTASALTWTWYFLCQHPECYQKVQAEVDQVLQGQPATFNDLPRLPYCLQVFKEAMRIYPPVAGIMREAMDTLEIDGYRIPKGTTVLISPYTLHRRPDYFPNPERFDPERFAPEREKALAKGAYLPFGAGPRICIGNHLALMEAQLLIATIVQKVNFTLLPDQQIEPDTIHNLALRPGGKVNVKVSKR